MPSSRASTAGRRRRAHSPIPPSDMGERIMRHYAVIGARTVRFCSVLALTAPAVLASAGAGAEQPPAPCHPNPNAAADSAAVAARGDVVNLPKPLKDRLIRLADRPHTYLPMQAFAEAHNPDGTPKPSQLFQYYL